MGDVIIFTAQEKADCADRELRYRKRVYQRWIERGILTKAKADREIALMESICSDYQALAQKERLL
jgi:hypothetical protein